MAAHPPRRRRRRRRHAQRRVRAAREPRARSSSTRSTTDRTSRRRARAITAATSRSCARKPPARSSCSARRRRRSRASTTPRAAATSWSRCARRVLDRPMAARHIVDMRAEFAAEGPDVDPERAAARRACGAARARRTGDRAAQPARVRDRRLLPAVRRDARVPELQRVADRAQGGGPRALPLLQLLGAAAEDLPQVRRAVISSSSASAPSGSRRRSARCSRRRVSARVDRDTIRRRGAIAALLAQFAAGELDVLVGTQMIAKGHDFPRVTLVGVISADVGLGLADFRAGRAHVPAADAGRRPRRPRRDRRRSDRADALSRPLQHPPRVPIRTTRRSTPKS